MKRPTAQDLVDALEHARRNRNVGWGICLCLPNNPAGKYLAEYIDRQLDGSLFLTGWLILNQPTRSRHAWQIAEYRLQWIDWMIASIKETG